MANMTSNEQLREALVDVSLWLRAALNCKQWVWDSDQRLAAMGCLVEADQALCLPVETNDDLKAALLWLLHWQNPRTKLEECLWKGRGHAPEKVADTIDKLCREEWSTEKASEDVRKIALDEIVRLSEDAGLYDLEG